uniref:Uncharacterized protein n=1 Tax=Brassica oleracea var. oleracea TaxID=109376 RepID=A0A0D2ZY31_BRAOL
MVTNATTLRIVKASPMTRSTKSSANLSSRLGRIRSIFPLTDLEQRFRNMTTREYLTDIASLCVKKLNEEKLYITFMAREYPDGSLVEYQAKAMDFAGGVEPPFSILCRPAPTMS